ncbi:hypothetical protein GQF42_16160 [Streptomyces broussonetiae]|uniref:Uncharacterized protein n=1 Tax=Streptomyces broussonetiae TaxID=2686304 RepID=A0A6I6MZ68_9ACTN|nr:hypothetical protein [Streptomyces broussonetiae]QHA04622.1 hypothetical protein GQF42_16160 [Streptomyces broussonetiae]
MSELDLGLKVASRRLLWRMGYTTRLDVQLRSVGAAERPTAGAAGAAGRSRRSSVPEAFTDLDVLGITVTGGFRLQSAIVDCKTTVKGSTSRMFWVRGVADFFAADAAYMVREKDLSNAARQLTSRLGIAALTSAEVTRLEELHPSHLALDAEPLAWLFQRDKAATVLGTFNGLDKRLKPLLEYREFTYWLAEEHRNPMQLVDELTAVARYLDPRNPHHLALVLDCAWLYLLTLSHAVESLRAAHVADPDRGLQEYLFGGPAGLSEKQGLSRLLEGIKQSGALPDGVHVDLLPSYFPRLRELAIRILTRADSVLPALRLLEFATSVTALGQRIEKPEDMGGLYDDVAAKRAADVVGFLVGTAGLDNGFRARARSLLLGEPMT